MYERGAVCVGLCESLCVCIQYLRRSEKDGGPSEAEVTGSLEVTDMCVGV